MNFKNFLIVAGTLSTSLLMTETASAGGRHHHGGGGYGYNPPIVVYNAPPYGGRGYGHRYERCNKGGYGRGHGHGWGHQRRYSPAPVVIYNQGYENGYGNYGHQRPYYDSGVGFNINLGGRL